MALPDVKPIPTIPTGHTGIWTQKNFDDFSEALRSKHTCCHSAFQELSDNARAVGCNWNASQLHIDLKPQHGWGTKQLEICTVLENGKGMSGAELENLFHLGHERKARQQMDIDNAIYAHFGIGELAALENLSSDTFVFTDNGSQWAVARYGTILNDELCRLELKDATAGMATVTLTFQRGSVDDRGLDWSYHDEATNKRALKAMVGCRSPFRDVLQLLLPFREFRETFGSACTGVLTAIVVPRVDGDHPVITGGAGLETVRDIIQASGDVHRFENSKFLSVYLQRAYLPPGRQQLFPLVEAGDPPGMEPSEQVIFVSGNAVDADEHPWAKAVVAEGVVPSSVLSVAVEGAEPCAWMQFCYQAAKTLRDPGLNRLLLTLFQRFFDQAASTVVRRRMYINRQSGFFFFRRDRAILWAADGQRWEDLASVHRLLHAMSAKNQKMLGDAYGLLLKVCGRDEEEEFDFLSREQWTKLARADKPHAYAMTGAGLVGIIRVDCLAQDEPKEQFKESAMKRKVYNAVYERMLRYAVENPPPDCTEILKAQRAAKQAEAVAARRAQATAWKACAPERAAAAEKAAAAQKAALEKAATRKAAAAAKAAQHAVRAVSGRAQPTAARSPTTSVSERDVDSGTESESEDDAPGGQRKRKAPDNEPTFTVDGRRPVKKPTMYSPSKMAMAGMGLASTRAGPHAGSVSGADRGSLGSAAEARKGSAAPSATANGGSAAAAHRRVAASDGGAQRSPTPSRRQGGHRELAAVPGMAEADLVSQLEVLADSLPPSPATLRSRLDAARRAGGMAVNRCMKQQQDEYNTYKKRLFDLVQQCSGSGP